MNDMPSENHAAATESGAARAVRHAPARTTYFVVPGVTEDPARCRIVAREHWSGKVPARDDYARNPAEWREVGLMNAQGCLVCFDGPAAHRQLLQDCEPLSGGLEIGSAPDSWTRVSDLHRALRSRDEYDSDEDIARRIAEMRSEVAAGADPEEVLFDEGLEPDYVLDLL